MKVEPFTKQELAFLRDAAIAYGHSRLRNPLDFERIEELEAVIDKITARQMALQQGASSATEHKGEL